MSVMPVHSWRRTACACHNPYCFVPTSVHPLCCHVGGVIHGHATPHLPPGCHGSRAWALAGLITTSRLCGVIGVVAVSAWHHRIVVGGVLLGVAHCSPAHRNVISILKLKEKKTHQWDQEVTSPNPVGHLIGPPCRHFHRLDLMAVVPVIAVPCKPLVSSQFPCMCSQFRNTH